MFCVALALMQGNLPDTRGKDRMEPAGIVLLAALPRRRLAGESPARVAGMQEAVCPNTLSDEMAGFTLIELSIVLVIIGLIVGGVLVGQDLIKAAQVRATIAQIEKYNTAANTFYGKYGYLPGDIPDPQATQFGLLPGRFSTPGAGNGDGIVSGYQTFLGEATGETAVFWVDLSTAHMIDGGFTTGSLYYTSQANQSPDITLSTSPNISAYFPEAKLGGGNYIYVYPGLSWSASTAYTFTGINYFGLSAVSVIKATSDIGRITSAPGLTVQQAYAIDKKIDDGLPESGKVIATYLNTEIYWSNGISNANNAVFYTPSTVATAPSPTTCYDNGGVAGLMAYSLSQNNGAGVNCALSFQFQAGD